MRWPSTRQKEHPNADQARIEDGHSACNDFRNLIVFHAFVLVMFHISTWQLRDVPKKVNCNATLSSTAQDAYADTSCILSFVGNWRNRIYLGIPTFWSGGMGTAVTPPPQRQQRCTEQVSSSRPASKVQPTLPHGIALSSVVGVTLAFQASLVALVSSSCVLVMCTITMNGL